MSEKILINFSAEAEEKIFKPFLKKLLSLQGIADRKIISYIVAEENFQLSELTNFLEKISRDLNFKICTIELENFLGGEFDLDKLQAKIREIKFEDDDDEIILLAGNENLLSGNLRALADYLVLIQAEKKFSVTGNEIWQLQGDGNFLKLDSDDEEIFV